MVEAVGEISSKRVIIASDSLPYAFRVFNNNNNQMSLRDGPLSPPAIFADLEMRTSSIRPRRRSRAGVQNNIRRSMSDSTRLSFNGSANLGPSITAPEPSYELVTRTNHAAYWVAVNLSNPVVHIGKPVYLEVNDDEAASVDCSGATQINGNPNGKNATSCRDQHGVIAQLYSQKSCRPVFIDQEVAKGHWDGYCRSCLWPLFHNTLWEGSIDTHCRLAGQFEQYSKVNEAFAEEILRIWTPNDIVWILDYHLMLLPGILRTKIPEMVIGLYLRSPFPSSEFFRCLPQAKDILQGMLGANVIGFQNFGYARHFTNSCTRLLGCEISQSTVDNFGIPVSVTVQPIGIDATRIKEMQQSDSVQTRVNNLREAFIGKRIILGIESVDHHRGFIHKLQALKIFYQQNPQHQGQVALVQVLLPGPDPNFKVDSRAIDLVSQINAEFGSLEFTPIHFYYQAVENDEYLALLQIADVLLITSERDSVNTIFLDYVASQSERCGLPIVSEFIGSSSILPETLQVNPWDHSGVAAVLNAVLAMPIEERRSLYERVAGFVNANSANHWVKSFLESISCTGQLLDIYQPTPFLSIDRLINSFMDADSRLILFDYDGTLTPIRPTPGAAIPSGEVIRALRQLTADPRNQVYVISGRDQATLEGWLGSIPRLGMSAEHGCFLRPISEPGEAINWMSTINMDSLIWRDDVIQIMEYYTERTPGSFVEHKKASITWHYRLADPDFGSWQSKELQTHLEQIIASKYNVEIIAGKKNLEVRPTSSNKGEIIKSLLVRHGRPKFILCAGDDKTDEDMFRALLEEFSEAISPATTDEWCFTCSIGHSSKKTLAKYHVNTPEQIIATLMRICQLASDRVSGVTM